MRPRIIVGVLCIHQLRDRGVDNGRIGGGGNRQRGKAGSGAGG